MRDKYLKMCSLILGGICFSAGFFGPMVFGPNDNLGPMRGFVTGPIGFVLGIVLGAIMDSLNRRNPNQPDDTKTP